MQNLIDLEKKINSELTTKIKKTEIRHDQLYINIDNEDSLIIGCNGGLFRFSEPHWSIIQPPVFQQPLWDIREWIVATIVTNDTSNIYGAWNVGLAIDNETKFNFLRGSEFQMDTNRFQINQLKYDNFENLWIGTRFGEVIVYNPSGLNF